MVPKELRAFLDEWGVSPKRSLSQNFLVDRNIVSKIVKAAEIEVGERVIEVGPGPGAITDQLLKAGAHVIAIEKDETLARALLRLQTPDKRLEVVPVDVLDHAFTHTKPLKVVANLPYGITTPVVTRFLANRAQFSRLIIMIQDELARRYTTSRGSSISLFIQFYAQATYAFKVSRHCSYPVPKVDSAVVDLTLRTPPPVDDVDAFFKLVRSAFGKRRKMLRASLKGLPVAKALKQMGLEETVRPEELSLDQFLAFYAACARE